MAVEAVLQRFILLKTPMEKDDNLLETGAKQHDNVTEKKQYKEPQKENFIK